jgi:hypothetical protein
MAEKGSSRDADEDKLKMSYGTKTLFKGAQISFCGIKD